MYLTNQWKGWLEADHGKSRSREASEGVHALWRKTSGSTFSFHLLTKEEREKKNENDKTKKREEKADEVKRG